MGDHFYFDYVGITGSKAIETKSLIVVSDRKTKQRKLYIVYKKWLDLHTGTVMVLTVITTNTLIATNVLNELLTHEYDYGLPSIFVLGKSYNIKWSQYDLRSIYGHFGKFFY